jgi:type VI secretion system secreted protein VgrG
MAYASKVTIEIDGEKIPDFLHLTINQGFNRLHDFQVYCRRDVFEKAEDSPLSSSMKNIGSVITFYIEGIDSGVNSKDFFFKGIITSISASESLSNQEIIFSGHSPDILLHGYPTCRVFENMTLKQIVQEVLSPYPADQISLKCDPADSSQYPYIVQYKETNYEFIRRLAARFGEWFFFDGRNLIFGAFEKESTNGELGINLLNFSIGARLAPLKFDYASYFYGSATMRIDSSSKYDVTNCLNNIGKQAHDQSLTSFADQAAYYFPGAYVQDDGSSIQSANSSGEVEKEKQKIASGMVVVNGSSYEALQLGNILQIKSFNIEKNSGIDVGDFLITGLSHSVDNSLNYQNVFTGIPAESKISPDNNVNAVTHCETQYAVVKEVNDPEKQGRIRVRFLWGEASNLSPWIHISGVNSGSGKGFYFLPEVHEMVLVGFEGNDVEKPFVIGSMRNGKEKPDSEWVTDSNDIKSIRSRSGHTVEFNDTKGSEELCIYNGTRKDPTNMMRLKVSDNGYEIFSKGPINLASNGDISLKGKNINLEAQDGGTVRIFNKPQMGITLWDNGQIQINVPEDAKFDLAVGSAGKRIEADIQGIKITAPMINVNADAVTEIKGGIVNIN